MGLSSGRVWMWKLDCEEGWAPKNWCFWTVLLEKTLESPLDCKKIQPVHSKGDQSWVFFGSNDAEAETPILWPPDVKSWLIWKDPDDGKDWGQEEKGMTEDEMAGWHHQLNRHQFSSVQFNFSVVSDSLWPHCSMPGFPVHHQLSELAQTHVHRVGDAIQSPHPLSSPSPPTFNLSQHQSLF